MAEEQPCQEHGLRKKEKDGQEHSNLVKYNRHCGFEALYIQKVNEMPSCLQRLHNLIGK